MSERPIKKFKKDMLISDGSARLKILPESEEYSITTLHSEDLSKLKKILKDFDSRNGHWKSLSGKEI
jgi:hypothetical protein